MSNFFIGSNSQSATSTPAQHSSPSLSQTPNFDYSDDEEDTLPYPTELPRKDFLTPDFDPQTYLSTLRNRHQTLEDLRSDLRSRSQLLNQELLDLVNGHYEEFLGLGAGLKGGEEKVEGVRVGVLGFGREVAGVRTVVKEREVEVGKLLGERKEIRKETVLGRGLLEVEEQISELEGRLGITDKDEDEDDLALDSDGDGEEDEAGDTGSGSKISIRRLQRHTTKYLIIVHLIQKLGSEHPFLMAQQPRMQTLRKTLLLDLAAGLRQAKALKDRDSTLGIVQLYGELGAEAEGMSALKAG